MGTRHIIAIKNDDGVRSIYCQYDGHPAANGVTLSHFYADRNKINALMDFGDIGDLANEVNQSRRLGTYKPGPEFEPDVKKRKGVQYDTASQSHPNVKDMMCYWSNSDLEFMHLFDDGKWQIYQPGERGENSRDITSWVRDKDAEKLVADIIAGKVEDKCRALGKPKSKKKDMGVNL